MKFKLERTNNVVRSKLEIFSDKTVYESEINLKTDKVFEIDQLHEIYGRSEQYEKCADLLIEIENDIKVLTNHLQELEQEETRIDDLPYRER